MAEKIIAARTRTLCGLLAHDQVMAIIGDSIFPDNSANRKAIVKKI